MPVRTISILGCGWLGLPLATHLVEQGYRVKGSTTTPEKLDVLSSHGIQSYLIRLTPDLPHKSTDFFESDALFLNIPPGRRDPDVRERFAKQIESLLKSVSTSFPWVILASSTSVYPDLNRIVTEADGGGGITASGQALLDAERTLHEALPSTTILRFAGLYGYERKIGRFLAGRRGVEHGDAPVNLVHRDDCIQVIAEVIRQERTGAVLNVCADEHPTRKELYIAKAVQQGLKPPAFSVGAPLRFKLRQ